MFAGDFNLKPYDHRQVCKYTYNDYEEGDGTPGSAKGATRETSTPLNGSFDIAIDYVFSNKSAVHRITGRDANILYTGGTSDHAYYRAYFDKD